MSVGNKGKFNERIKKIAFRKRNRVNKIDSDDGNLIYTNFLKVIAAIPGMVYGNMVFDDNHKSDDNKILKTSKVERMSLDQRMYMVDSRKLTSDQIRGAINGIDIDHIKEKQTINCSDVKKRSKFIFDNKNNGTLGVQRLEKEILDIIKQRLIKYINEMEILQSELYVLTEINGNDDTLKKCQEEIEQIKLLLDRVRSLKGHYDFLKDNYDFEYLTQIDDNCLVDKIIELKDMFDNNEVKALTHDYKLLEEYKYLYLKIDDLAEKMVIFEHEKLNKEAELKQREIDFESFKNNVYNIDNANLRYNEFVKEQNRIMAEIDENIGKISNHEVVNYHLKGFNQLFLNSFKYFGLLMLNPLKGFIPSIATETLITKNMIHNLYKNLTWEENRKVVYEAIDYSTLIKSAINDLEHTNNVVDTTLDDIVRLKMQYNEQFKKYQGDSMEYIEVMEKINNMENKILDNKIKIEIMRKRALEQEKINNQKLKLVNKLNYDQN